MAWYDLMEDGGWNVEKAGQPIACSSVADPRPATVSGQPDQGAGPDVSSVTPQEAQRVVAAYLKVVEDHAAADVYPGALRDLPHSKEIIRAAFRVSTTALAETGQLTPELRAYLEIAYVSLADYLDDEGAALLREYASAGQELAADPRRPREKTGSDAWRRVSEQSRLAGQIARAISDEAEALRGEFRSWHQAVGSEPA